ncbi:MAG: GAF domain-containing protein [Chloroflexi bacterium]|jgi:DNA-binding winged helix-turn-helix (wHTH) protein|nr:GAF domain-containing protein [Chloroflexota bacterium]MBT5627602.1 GAF domain-containing protein [Chloroflexota bacterium]
MTLISSEHPTDTTDFSDSNKSPRWKQSLLDNLAGYSLANSFGLAVAITVGLATGTSLVVIPFAIALGIVASVVHVRSHTANTVLQEELFEANQQLASEASASRILGGIRVLRGNNVLSQDARLASAARMATEYPAAVVFNLRDAHGVLSPSNWSYEGQLGHIRDSFEPIGGDDPGATAARQGSAIVISDSDDGAMTLPSWAEQAGFRQGIVAPITRGLDTIGVIYVLNKSLELPTLKEIEQLELMVSFGSLDGLIASREHSSSQSQPFRAVEIVAPTNAAGQTTSPIRMSGFALNPESERMEMDGTLISLSPTEFMLMHTLASSPDQPVSAVELMDRCWSKDSRPADNAVDVAIFRLRKKLNKTASGKGLIKTVRGSGYMFIPPAADSVTQIIAD